MYLSTKWHLGQEMTKFLTFLDLSFLTGSKDETFLWTINLSDAVFKEWLYQFKVCPSPLAFVGHFQMLCSHDGEFNLSTKLSSVLFTLIYNIYVVYDNVGIKNKYFHKRAREKKEINGFGRSVWWSEELSFRANHRFIMNGHTTILNMCSRCHDSLGEKQYFTLSPLRVKQNSLVV